jgi:hypothetical protein
LAGQWESSGEISVRPARVGSSGRAWPAGDLPDIERAAGNFLDQVERFVIGETRGTCVQVEEDHRGQPGQPLVAIDERAVVGDGVEKCCGFERDREG